VPNHIGIVDDDELVREGLKDCLESGGYAADTFGSAEEYLASESSPRLSCLILDIELSGMTGLELQAKLAMTGNRVPIIFVTAHADDTNRKQALKNGAAAFLAKPFRREELLNAVRTVIEQ
jgi:FixJ family two-component response regulator